QRLYRGSPPVPHPELSVRHRPGGEHQARQRRAAACLHRRGARGLHRGFYTVDVRYFYRVTADAFVGAARPVEISGLCVFDKRVILFGSEGGAKTFSSEAGFGELDGQEPRKCGLPTAVVEAVDPIVLSMKLVDVCECRPCDCELTE